MATILHPITDLLQVAPLHRFSTADYLKMIEKGVLGPTDRVELIEGIITEMSPAGSRHNHFLGQLNRLFADLLEKHEVWIQGTLLVEEAHVFDPDFMILERKPGGYKHKLPGPQDVLLLVEAAETSLRRDQQIKLPVYANAGIAEYWIADLDREVLAIHRHLADGRYQTVEIRRGDDIISPLAAPEIQFAVREAFE